MSNPAVANVILAQLGGGRFRAMTGAKDMAYGDDSLQFGVGRAKRGINKVVITLLPNDTYRVRFCRFAKLQLRDVEVLDGVYADQLREVFTSATGLHTSL